jgi:hypothetical protein
MAVDEPFSFGGWVSFPKRLPRKLKKKLKKLRTKPMQKWTDYPKHYKFKPSI